MKTEEFVTRLKELLQERGYTNLESRSTDAPGAWIGCNFQGVQAEFDLVVGGKAVLRVPEPQPFQLTLKPESTVSRILDAVGHSQEIKTGFAEFDERYLIQLHPPTMPLFNPDTIQAIYALEPFNELTAGRHGLELHKTWELSTFRPEDAALTVDSLMLLSHLARMATKSAS